MKKRNDTAGTQQKQMLLALCRFLTLRTIRTIGVSVLFGIGLLLSLTGHSQFAPYGIAMLYLLLPVFLEGNAPAQKKENKDTVLSSLCTKYHYSLFSALYYRISYLLCAFLLLAWHLLSPMPLSFALELPLPLLLLASLLAAYPVASRILYLRLHKKLMDGEL